MIRDVHHPLPSNRQLDTLELLAVGYLLLPVLVFLLGWLRQPYALLLPCAMLPAWRMVWRARRPMASTLSATELWACATITAIWVSLSGLADGFHLNLDWLTRMSVLRDLVAGGWPASYSQQTGGDLILRCPLGYYLVPALVGKLSSLSGARLALWVWTALGTVLFLFLLVSARAERGRHDWRFSLLIAVFFSGLDIVGWLLFRQHAIHYGEHIEWWNSMFQYSSQTTLLFWVPNHALPGWLLALVIWRHRQEGLAVTPAALLLLGVMFWAPLVALGVAPLLLWCVLREQGARDLLAEGLHLPLLALLPAGLLIWRYLTMNVLEVTSNAAIDPIMLAIAVGIFCTLEWGLLASVIVRNGARSPLLSLAMLELLLLPFLHFGPANDLVMRGSIPALAVLMMSTINAWHAAKPAGRAAIAALLLIGSITPLLELQRAFLPGPRYLHAQRNFIEVNGTPWHYLSALTRPEVVALLKPPQPMPASTLDRIAASAPHPAPDTMQNKQ